MGRTVKAAVLAALGMALLAGLGAPPVTGAEVSAAPERARTSACARFLQSAEGGGLGARAAQRRCDRVFIWSHRGWTLPDDPFDAFENTMPAFRKWYRSPFRRVAGRHGGGSEADLWPLKTGQMVLNHDEDVGRTIDPRSVKALGDPDLYGGCSEPGEPVAYFSCGGAAPRTGSGSPVEDFTLRQWKRLRTRGNDPALEANRARTATWSQQVRWACGDHGKRGDGDAFLLEELKNVPPRVNRFVRVLARHDCRGRIWFYAQPTIGNGCSPDSLPAVRRAVKRWNAEHPRRRIHMPKFGLKGVDGVCEQVQTPRAVADGPFDFMVLTPTQANVTPGARAFRAAGVRRLYARLDQGRFRPGADDNDVSRWEADLRLRLTGIITNEPVDLGRWLGR